MPTYVYGCDACGHRFEKFQKFSDEPVRVCPECQSSVRRLLQPAGIVFKGSGWHVTDYKRSNGNGNGSEESNGGEAKAKTNGDGATELKPAETKSESNSESTSSAKATPPSTSTT